MAWCWGRVGDVHVRSAKQGYMYVQHEHTATIGESVPFGPFKEKQSLDLLGPVPIYFAVYCFEFFYRFRGEHGHVFFVVPRQQNIFEQNEIMSEVGTKPLTRVA